jgi:hypothetical protein
LRLKRMESEGGKHRRLSGRQLGNLWPSSRHYSRHRETANPRSPGSQQDIRQAGRQWQQVKMAMGIDKKGLRHRVPRGGYRLADLILQFLDYLNLSLENKLRYQDFVLAGNLKFEDKFGIAADLDKLDQ